jgi:glutamate--cysteine ligase
MNAMSHIDLRSIFMHPPEWRPGRIGIEVECGIVDPRSGISVPYEGTSGSCALLRAIRSEFNGTSIAEEAILLGVRIPSGAEISLEMGGALEYSSAPNLSVAEVIAQATAEISQIASISKRLGLSLLFGSMVPFTAIGAVPWIPKKRVQIMRNYFSGLGDDGALADGVMGLTLSTQVTFDYESFDDLARKLRMQVGVSPIVAALSVNSPIENGEVAGPLSRRLQFWKKIDPARCGVLPFAVGQEPQVPDILDWACNLPMIYRPFHDSHISAPLVPFRELLAHGFDDGSPVSLTDWECLLNQVWPHVRARRTLELRAADGLPWPHFGCIAALWTGLTYHRPSLDAALELVANVTAEQLQGALDDAAVKGLSAYLGRDSMQDLARELIRLAVQGLTSRIAAGIEPEGVLALLEPLEGIVESGVTFAEHCIQRWTTDLEKSPQKYVEAFSVPSTAD